MQLIVGFKPNFHLIVIYIEYWNIIPNGYGLSSYNLMTLFMTIGLILGSLLYRRRFGDI